MRHLCFLQSLFGSHTPLVSIIVDTSVLPIETTIKRFIGKRINMYFAPVVIVFKVDRAHCRKFHIHITVFYGNG